MRFLLSAIAAIGLLLPASAMSAHVVWAQSFSQLPAATVPLGGNEAVPMDQGSGCAGNTTPCTTVQVPSERVGQPLTESAGCATIATPFTYQLCIDTSSSPAVMNQYINNAWVPLYTLSSSGPWLIPGNALTTPFLLGSTSVTTTGTQLNYLNAAAGTTGSASSSLVFSSAPTITGATAPNLTVTGSFTATGLVTNNDLANDTMTINGTNCVLGAACSPALPVVVGATTISGGSNNNLLFDNAGLFGEVTTADNGLVVTSATGVPSVSTTITPIIVGASVTAPHVATLSALEASKTATYPSGVWRDDYSAGLGAPPLFYLGETGTCASNSRIADGGSCADTTSGDGNSFYVAAWPASGIDVREFGAAPGVTDASVGINLAVTYANSLAAVSEASQPGPTVVIPGVKGSCYTDQNPILWKPGVSFSSTACIRATASMDAVVETGTGASNRVAGQGWVGGKLYGSNAGTFYATHIFDLKDFEEIHISGGPSGDIWMVDVNGTYVEIGNASQSHDTAGLDLSHFIIDRESATAAPFDNIGISSVNGGANDTIENGEIIGTSIGIFGAQADWYVRNVHAWTDPAGSRGDMLACFEITQFGANYTNNQCDTGTTQVVGGTAAVTGSISGTTLTISAIGSGQVTSPQTVAGIGVTPGTDIENVGTCGGASPTLPCTATVNFSQTVGSISLQLGNVYAFIIDPQAGYSATLIGNRVNSQYGTNHATLSSPFWMGNSGIGGNLITVANTVECTSGHAYGNDYTGTLTGIDTIATFTEGCVQETNTQYVSLRTGALFVGGARAIPSTSYAGNTGVVIDYNGNVAGSGSIYAFSYSGIAGEPLDLQTNGTTLHLGGANGSTAANYVCTDSAGKITVQAGAC